MAQATVVKRPPAVAGYFYPAHERELRETVRTLLNEAKSTPLNGELVGLVAPHAGYMYSGLTAAYAYRLLRNKKFDSIVVIGPSHREYFDGVSIYPGSSFVTPLGEMPIDEELRERIVESYPASLSSRGRPSILLSDVGHRLEHSVEVQVPFLQEVVPGARFVPIVMGDQSRYHCVALADALARALEGKNVLLVASSDLSHYHSYDEAVALDRRVIDDVKAFDAETLMEDLQNEVVEACGGGPMVAVMMAARRLGAEKSVVLFHCNSGDVTGERDRVVGYMSAAFLRVH